MGITIKYIVRNIFRHLSEVFFLEIWGRKFVQSDCRNVSCPLYATRVTHTLYFLHVMKLPEGRCFRKKEKIKIVAYYYEDNSISAIVQN